MEKLISKKRLLPLFALICAFLWGCGFSVTVEGRSDRLVKIMEDNGISYKSISSAQGK